MGRSSSVFVCVYVLCVLCVWCVCLCVSVCVCVCVCVCVLCVEKLLKQITFKPCFGENCCA
jgi:hypothetical protein